MHKRIIIGPTSLIHWFCAVCTHKIFCKSVYYSVKKEIDLIITIFNIYICLLNLIIFEMNIYAGNLNYNISEEDLEKVFSEYGEVTSVKIIRDKYTDQSKGFGFIEMTDDAAAQKAIDELNGTEVKGRELRVNQARPPREQ